MTKISNLEPKFNSQAKDSFWKYEWVLSRRNALITVTNLKQIIGSFNDRKAIDIGFKFKIGPTGPSILKKKKKKIKFTYRGTY